nr:MAG TPA: hypothetical protein [Caudoviricetes sp.]
MRSQTPSVWPPFLQLPTLTHRLSRLRCVALELPPRPYLRPP